MIKLEEERSINTIVIAIDTSLKYLATDINYLKGIIEGSNGDLVNNIERFNEEFYQFTYNKKVYDQVRFIDKSGMEVIRINNNNGNPAVVGKDELQNKSDRYYFKEAITL